MDDWDRFVSTVGEARFLSVLGGLEIVMALVRILLWESGRNLPDLVTTDLLIILPGLVLLYGGYRLPDWELRRETHSLIVARCLAGIGAMIGVVGLLAISTGLNRPIFTPMVGTALGSVAGFLIGTNEARALSKAYDAEQARKEVAAHRDELRQERDLRERIIEASPIGIVILESDGSVKMANERAAQIIGLSTSEIESLDHYKAPTFEITDAEGNPIEGGLFEEVLTKGEAVYDIERQITRADGKRIWLSLNGAPLRDPAEDGMAVIVGFEDISERKTYEQKLEESNERLEQFAYAASHDLQEPLRMVSSYLQLLDNRYKDDLDEDAKEFIEFAVDGAERMREMIESLLEYSRVTTKGKPFERTDAEAVLEEVLEDIQLQIDETNATITTGELPTVTVDPDQLAQVFQNLISNALQYSGDEPPTVYVGAERTDGVWRFEVTDEGIGVDPDYHERIFEVFESVHTDGEAADSGIGLAMCERILERHGGDIWVDSEPGEGTTFYFTIPVREGQQAESAADSLPVGDEEQGTGSTPATGSDARR